MSLGSRVQKGARQSRSCLEMLSRRPRRSAMLYIALVSCAAPRGIVPCRREIKMV